MIAPELIRDLRASVRIDGVAEAAGLQLKDAGRGEKTALCPFHLEKTPSFSVSLEKGLFHCFGCGAGGDAINLYQRLHGCTFPVAVEELASLVGLSVGADHRRSAEEEAAQFFQGRLGGSHAQRFLEERKVPASVAEAFRLGFAPVDPTPLFRFLKENYSANELSGLVSRDGKLLFHHRLMIPILNQGGRVVGMSGRSLGDREPKYLNARGGRSGDHLYGLYQARRAARESGELVLVEGFFDAWACSIVGRPAVAQMGGSLSARQVGLLAKHARRVTIAMDGDDAGRRAYVKALPQLLRAGLFVRAAFLPQGHDPDSFRQAEGGQALLALLDGAPDAVEAEVRRLGSEPGDALGRQRALDSARHLISWLPRRQAAARQRYVEVAADAFRLPAHHFQAARPKARKKARKRPIGEEALLYCMADGHRFEGVEVRHFADQQCGRIFQALSCPQATEDGPLETALQSLEAEDMERFARSLVMPVATAAHADAKTRRRLTSLLTSQGGAK